MGGDRLDGDDVARVGWRMRIDHQTIAVVTALREREVEPVLLKGPAIARWLYDAPGERIYGDVDLLVALHDRPAAEAVLVELGYAPLDEPPPPHADTWVRAGDHGAVDLHRCLHHTERVPPEQVWDEVWTGHEPLDLFGTEVAVPSEAVRALHVVLHVQPKDEPGTQAWTDAERAVARLDRAVWAEAVAVADRLGVRGEMGALLALVEGGPALAASLGLSTAPTPELEVHHRRRAPAVTSLRLALRGRSRREQVAVVAAKLSHGRVRSASSRGEDSGLARAYLEQARRAAGALRAWARDRRHRDGWR